MLVEFRDYFHTCRLSIPAHFLATGIGDLDPQCREAAGSLGHPRTDCLNHNRPSASSLLDLLGLGTLGGGPAVVVRDPALVVGLVKTRGDTSRRFVAREGLWNLDLLDLLAGAGSLLGLREKGLDPSLVDEVKSTAKSASEEDVEEDTICLHANVSCLQ